MENIAEEKERLLKRLEEINEQITDDVIKNATNEELMEFVSLSEQIRAKIKMLNDME